MVSLSSVTAQNYSNIAQFRTKTPNPTQGQNPFLAKLEATTKADQLSGSGEGAETSKLQAFQLSQSSEVDTRPTTFSTGATRGSLVDITA